MDDDPYDYRHSKSWVNAQGKQQGTCTHCGNCDLGCRSGQNTLDLNYLAAAESAGAEIRLHHVHYHPLAGGGMRCGQGIWTVIVGRFSCRKSGGCGRFSGFHRVVAALS